VDVLDKIELLQGDVRDADLVRRACRGAETVVHLAAINGTEFFYSQPELVLDVAIRGMLAVVDACRAERVPDLITASSSEAYQTPPSVPTDESVPLMVPDVFNPRYSYGGGKIATELIAANYGRRGFRRLVIFRPHNVYGPQMGWEHVIPQLALRACAAVVEHPSGSVPFPIQGDGSQTRAFIHIDDFTNGLLRVIDRGEHLHVYHIGNPEEVSVADLARLIVSHFGRTVELLPSEAPAGGTARRCPDISRLKALGFQPKISLTEGLPPVIDWYVDHRDLVRKGLQP
jgi:dTDP-glucose 4,6-dehydratase/UDP-glucose 4-epimerase